ncbi:GDP-L-fucose synthase [Methyloversatilis sp. XJ19-13]|uniref:GDP-L-fucose synthase family protein n=1 Tax=Methyloversatilis sp. XJ19-13 TaxID=2963430 RepID=UPI00211C12F3|nr:GDP-L-fucose synthase [Methyloversatilis sp. XJ19-13]MCQ9376029.1 GDP-L-fucose synthase [Methyloversatilis sp. XJ19-13]
MHKNARIYIAGHRGLVGSAIVRNLEAKGYTNLVTRMHAELDLTDAAATDAFFAAEKPEYVFLAAAKVGGIVANNSYPAEFIRDNLVIQTNVIHSAWTHGVTRLMFLGSSCIYPKMAQQPMREDCLLTGPLEPTNRPYALAKIAGIEMCWSYNRQYGTQYLAVMPTNLYGPGDNYSLMNSHVIPAMIRKFYLAKLASQRNWAAIEQDEAARGPIPDDLKAQLRATCNLNLESCISLWGTGTPRREFLYSDDMADACVFLINLPDDKYTSLLGSDESKSGRFEPPLVNVGVGEDVTIKELAELVGKVVGFDGDLMFDTTKPDGTPRKLMDVTRLNSIGWQASTGLAEGLARAFRDFQAGLSAP